MVLPKRDAIPVTASPPPCAPAPFETRLFHISIDGQDAGREVRSSYPWRGPLGEERVIVSHTVVRYQSHDVEIDRFTVETERFLAAKGTFLRGSEVQVDESAVRLSLVGYNGAGWDRVDEVRDTVEAPVATAPRPLELTGDELVGVDLNEHLAKLARGAASGETRPYYRTHMEAPLLLDFTTPAPDTLLWQGASKEVVRVSALRHGTSREVVTVLVDPTSGRILQEHYPAIHQFRTLATGPFTPPGESTDPRRGLFSDAYLGLPDGVTHATYHIVSRQPLRKEDFAFLNAPDNQTLTQLDPSTLRLTVRRGAPDGNRPAAEGDLTPSRYIRPDSPVIKNAWLYLKSGGRKGSLPPHRCDNAEKVVARARRIDEPSAFFAAPDEVARLVADYVHDLLPEKSRTQSMKDAVAALMDGLGDCTEHAVLFASLMRAAGIPTRLVSGMYLAHGGSWEFHMWNEYHDGRNWRAIDAAVGPTRDPGAHYVALSDGGSTFQDHRDHIAFFLDRSFSGLQFNLVEAGSNGEALTLARPGRRFSPGPEAVLFQAATLSARGNHQAALARLLEKRDPRVGSVHVELAVAELLHLNGRHAEALAQIDRVKELTSAPANVFLLDRLAFDAALARGDLDTATAHLSHLVDTLGQDDPTVTVRKASLLAASGQPAQGFQLLEGALIGEFHPVLATAAVELAARLLPELEPPQRQRALSLSTDLLTATHFASPSALRAAVRLEIAAGHPRMAAAYARMGLVLVPFDGEFNAQVTEDDRCGDSR